MVEQWACLPLLDWSQVEKPMASSWESVCENLEAQPLLVEAMCGVGKEEGKRALSL